MTITNDILKLIHVVSFSLIKNDKDYLIQLVKINQDLFTFSIASELNLLNDEIIKIQINKENQEQLIITSSIISHDTNYFTIQLSGENTSIFENILNIEKETEQYGRRKETRFEIGKSNYQNFELSNIEHNLKIDNQNMQKCAIVDVSFHGIQIITSYNNLIKKNDIFCIILNFKNPDEIITLKAHKINTRLKKINENKTYAYISCQLLEPISLLWKKRIINYFRFIN